LELRDFAQNWKNSFFVGDLASFEDGLGGEAKLYQPHPKINHWSSSVSDKRFT
jgi:hypothetical protein